MDSSSTAGDNLTIFKNKERAVETSYMRSMASRTQGRKALRRKLYRNLQGQEEDLILEWKPVRTMVSVLQSKLGRHALFFYNDLCPEVVAVLWRTSLLSSRPFSAMTCEVARPLDYGLW